MVNAASANDDADRGLARLEARVRHDLQCLNHPPPEWVPPTRHPQLGAVADVVVIGGGMCGLVASFALQRAGIGNIRIFDRNPEGFEGPWLTYARMETLRSPKQLTGPAYGMGSLTFRAWYEAQFGIAAWEALGKIPRPQWMEYLRWYRRVLSLPVENGVEVERIELFDGLLKLELTGAGEPFALARKVVLATGREGLGAPQVPGFVKGLPRERWAHSSDDIDFGALAGRRVVVIGTGASAVDNAAEALEAGAAEVRLLVRRKQMPRINKLMGIGSFGFTAGYAALDEEWRWRIMRYSFSTQTPAPRDSTLRVSRHSNAFFHFDSGITDMLEAGNAIAIATTRGTHFETDFVILGTGFTVDPLARKEIASYADRIAVWADRFTPPPDLADRELGRFPYLAGDFAFTERTPGEAPWLRNIHCFNYAASLSLGKVSGDIPAISDGARWLATGVAASLYSQDIERHWAALLAYDKPELLGDEWTDAEATEIDARLAGAAR
jgi:cation diffusion facilitator CzcD-associated flavoprotein CzcO